MHHRKKVLIAMAPSLLEQLDLVADSEFRNRSDCVREAVRLYIATSAERKKRILEAQTELTMMAVAGSNGQR